MQEEKITAPARVRSFGNFLRAYRLQVLIILALAFAMRAGVPIARPEVAADIGYRTTAINILEGYGYSTDTHPRTARAKPPSSFTRYSSPPLTPCSDATSLSSKCCKFLLTTSLGCSSPFQHRELYGNRNQLHRTTDKTL